MSSFDYLSVLVSIVVGFGLSEVLSGLARLARSRHRVKLYAPPLIWAATLILIFIQSWWAIFALHDHKTWTFLAFAVLLAHPLALSFTAALALPRESEGDEAIDLRESFERQRPWFFGALCLVVVASLLRPLAMDGVFPLGPDQGFQLFFLVLSAAAVIVRWPLYHQIMAPLVLALISVYIAALFANLG